MPIKRFKFGTVRDLGPDAISRVELEAPGNLVPDIVIYFAYNGYALHSFKNGEPYVAISDTRETLLQEIKALLKRGEKDGN